MLLRTSDELEGVLAHWFVENFGEEDTFVVMDWVWNREPNSARYLTAINYIAIEIQNQGREFFHNLLSHARRPKEEREIEEQLMETMAPYVTKALKAVKDHNEDPIVREEQIMILRNTLHEQIRKLWPEKHRATVDGAIICGTQIKNGGALLDYRAITQALTRNDDPLAATAASSHG